MRAPLSVLAGAAIASISLLPSSEAFLLPPNALQCSRAGCTAIMEPSCGRSGGMRHLAMLSDTPTPSKDFIASILPAAKIEKLWTDSRTLLRLGKGGVKASHINSLTELLQAHPSVRVKVNDATINIVEMANTMVAPKEEGDEPLGALLRVKGREFMIVTAKMIEELGGKE